MELPGESQELPDEPKELTDEPRMPPDELSKFTDELKRLKNNSSQNEVPIAEICPTSHESILSIPRTSQRPYGASTNTQLNKYVY